MGKSDRRRRLLAEIERLAAQAIFGTLSESYRTCGRSGCHCRRGGEKHGPHLYVSYRGDQGKTTGFYVPKAAEEVIRAGVDSWHQLQLRLKQLAELNKEQALGEARKVRLAR